MRDLILRLEHSLFGTRRLSVDEPANSKTWPGKFHDPPSDYTLLDVDVESLARWAEQCLSKSILSLIDELYSEEPNDQLRIIVTASEKLLATMMAAPWEALEFLNVNKLLPYYERLSVVRVLSTLLPPAEPAPAGEKLRIALTWANPRSDIPDLKKHLEDMRNLERDYPRELEIIGPHEFTSVEAVIDLFASHQPHVFYHIGHAEQSDGEKVKLLIGSSTAPNDCDVEKFRGLLQQVGPPRLLLLSACAAAVGFSPNAHLGAALSCAREIDAVIAMQAPVPVLAATALATTLFTRLANGAGLAEALKRARVAIGRTKGLPEGSGLSYARIPILAQRTRQDVIFTIDKSGRELAQLLISLGQALERIEPYLERSHDKIIRDFLATPSSAPHVALVKGRRGSGKSTSLRQILRTLLSPERFRAGQRCLYYEVQPGSIPSRDDDDGIRALIASFASSAAHSSLTAGLKRKLTAQQRHSSNDAVAALVAWLQEEHDQGKTYAICLDNVPPNLAAVIACKASSVLEQFGALLVVADDAEIEPGLPIRVIAVSFLTRGEIRTVLAGQRRNSDDSAVDRILESTNGIPYLVGGYLRHAGPMGVPLSNVGEAYLRDVASDLSPGEEGILAFAAYCDIPIPASLLEPEALTKRAMQRRLLVGSEADFYHVPDILRGPLRERFAADAPEIHARAFNGLVSLAEQHEASRDESDFQLVNRWLREALRHGLALMELEPEMAPGLRNDVRGTAEKLHDRYLNEADDIGPATAMWEDYRTTTLSLGLFDDRVSDTRYADCLLRLGKYDEADDLLESVTSSQDVDATQVTALLLRNELLKGRGDRAEYSHRIELLKQALDIVRKLSPPSALQRWIDQQTAGLEHTLGNAMGYGQDANPTEALQHLVEAQRLFEQLGDERHFGAVAEQIEIRRYNAEGGHLAFTEEDRRQAIETLRGNLNRLITRAMRGETIQHLYELGRLETDMRKRAEWFEQAFRRAGDRYAPWGLHAAINWRTAQITGGVVQFESVAGELKRYAEKLAALSSRAWSRRVRRNTWLFIAGRYEQAGDEPAALMALREARTAVLEIAKHGEGSRDLAKRRDIACRGGLLALKCCKREIALEFLAALPRTFAEEGTDALSAPELEQIFTKDYRGAG